MRCLRWQRGCGRVCDREEREAFHDRISFRWPQCSGSGRLDGRVARFVTGRGRRRDAGQACPADLGRRSSPDRPGLVRADPPRLGPGEAGPERRGVHARADSGSVGLVSRDGWTGHGWQPAEHRHLLRRQVERGSPAGGNHKLRRGCAGRRGAYFEQADLNPHSIDAGQGLSGLPGSILQMSGNATSLLDPAQLPVDPATCKPVYPHEYIKVNTVFEVARGAGLRTAWSDKHVAYEVLNGPSGAGIQDLFGPEINSDAPVAGSSNDWTKVNSLTGEYDSYKVQAVINEINGFDHSGRRVVGTPAILGMNFQTISTAEKLPASDGLFGGYLADGVTPGPLLASALDYINSRVGAMAEAIKDRHLDHETVIILSAKHGQSPQTPSALTRITDGPIMHALNLAWAAAHPAASLPLVAFSVDDDGMLVWLHYRSEAATV